VSAPDRVLRNPLGRPLCAATARARRDDQVGTTPVTRRWLFVEHPGPWAHDAFGGLGLPADVLDPLVAAIRAQGARALVVRRPGRQVPSADRAWGVLDQRGGWERWGRWAEPADLLAAAEALAADDGGPVAREAQSLLVCTHGRHDTCCAVWGRPVAAALAERWPEQTWECSHLGGDRFAANLLVAPDGLYYGYLDAAGAVDVVAGHLRGEVVADALRGFSHVPPVVQAALVAAHGRFGPAGARAFRGDEVTAGEAEEWQVDLVADAPLPARLRARVLRRRTEAAFLTCGAHQESRAAVFSVPELRPV
jgi:(2Fe-2S) ferredoxin